MHRPGVYVVAGRPWTWLGELWLGVLETGTDSFVCRRSVVAMWGLDGAPAGWIEIGVRGRSHSRRPGTTRMASIRTADLCRIGGLPVTRVARTLVDMAAVVEPEIVERGMECARLAAPGHHQRSGGGRGASALARSPPAEADAS